MIGQTKGILMKRYRLTGDAAFAHLTRASQDVSLKLSAVALHLVETGELLGGSGPVGDPRLPWRSAATQASASRACTTARLTGQLVGVSVLSRSPAWQADLLA